MRNSLGSLFSVLPNHSQFFEQYIKMTHFGFKSIINRLEQSNI